VCRYAEVAGAVRVAAEDRPARGGGGVGGQDSGAANLVGTREEGHLAGADASARLRWLLYIALAIELRKRCV
jgi:hypothetical protein